MLQTKLKMITKNPLSASDAKNLKPPSVDRRTEEKAHGILNNF
jgi:hypothetical protein